MTKLEIYQEERPWGNFRQFAYNILSTVKIITVKPNEILSLQSHKKRSEFWKIIKGNGIVEIGDLKSEAKEGDEYEISVGAKHRLSAGNGGIEVLEISTGEFDENDIIRYEDKYGRN
jgi:mannose-6-phosphate isomerase-like protein (cupin superfamily)